MIGAIARAAAKKAVKRSVANVAASKAARSGIHRGAQRGTAVVRGGSGGGSGLYLFVAHPNCCPKCNELGKAKRFFNTPDVAYITHPNCLCMTIEAPSGLTPDELRAWADNPIGGRMAYGFNYGVPLVSKKITAKNHEKTMAEWSERMANGGAWKKGTRKGQMKVRATVTPQKKGAVRRHIKENGFEKAKEIDMNVEPKKGQSFDSFVRSVAASEGKLKPRASASKTAKKKFAATKAKPKAGESFNAFLNRSVK